MIHETTVGELSRLLNAELIGDSQQSVSEVTHDSEQVRPGWLFCCIPGTTFDGHDFAQRAIHNGAVALLCSRPLGLGTPEIVVSDPRHAMAIAAAVLHGRPSESLTMVGITGTNGKTTVATILNSVLSALGDHTEMIGTLTGTRTTPESTDLQRDLAVKVDQGVATVVMEVSSHALELERVAGITFDIAVFTNLGSDHLDFHESQERYFAAKARLFEPGTARLAVLNLDDIHGRLLADASEIPVLGYSLDDIGELSIDADGSRFLWRGQQVHFPLPGRHNVSNALAAAEVAVQLGHDPAAVALALAQVPQVPGRFEVLTTPDGPTVVVDFAHTADALEQLLVTAREIQTRETQGRETQTRETQAHGAQQGEGGGRVVVVFGCGGDRDHDKRPEMGRVATELADVAIVTSDNPRSEDPNGIIADILAGCVRPPTVVVDRREAIRLAVADAMANDLVLVAGKGHETGQTWSDRTDPFDDRVEVSLALNQRTNTSAGGETAESPNHSGGQP